MNQAQAIRRLRKIIGDSLGYRINANAADADTRAEAQAAHPALRAEVEAAAEAVKQRRQAVLDADPEYQAAKARHAAAVDARDRASSIIHSHRIVVGRVASAGEFRMFTTLAEADNWADAVEKIEANARR